MAVKDDFVVVEEVERSVEWALNPAGALGDGREAAEELSVESDNQAGVAVVPAIEDDGLIPSPTTLLAKASTAPEA